MSRRSSRRSQTRVGQGTQRFDDSYQPSKQFCEDVTVMPDALANELEETAQPAVLAPSTGIGHLLPEPYLVGGGVHLTTSGGVLRPQTDFHHHRSGLHRRVNALLYPNASWPDAPGGDLCLFPRTDPEHPVIRVAPVAGRLVVFTTDDESVHGFPDPVPAGLVRRSIAVYYTVAESHDAFGGDSNTFWRTHADRRSRSGRLRMVAYRTLMKASRATSYLVHRVHPESPSVTRRPPR